MTTINLSGGELHVFGGLDRTDTINVTGGSLHLHDAAGPTVAERFDALAAQVAKVDFDIRADVLAQGDRIVSDLQPIQDAVNADVAADEQLIAAVQNVLALVTAQNQKITDLTNQLAQSATDPAAVQAIATQLADETAKVNTAVAQVQAALPA